MSQRAILASTGLVALGFAVVACSDPSARSQEHTSRRPLPVVGGEPAEVDDYPSAVALTDPSGAPFCTGTLVAPTVVVSAAHCLQTWWGDPLSTGEVRVVYGYTEPESAPAADRRTVASVTPHPSYDPWAPMDSDGMGHTNDIGVVVLDEAVAGGVIAPILPASQVDTTLVLGAEIHVVGFGVYNMNTFAGGILHKAITPYTRHIEWEMLAGSPGNPDSCNGDSGGPAYVVSGGNLLLVGVTSRAWAQSQQSCGDGGIYTLAPAYVDWIESVGGVLDGGVLDGGWDAFVDADLLDADPVCLPPTSACHPLTNEGCDTAAGEVCMMSGAGQLSCHPAPHDAQPGDLCDQTDRFCVQGFHCAESLRCERLCCSSADCPGAGPCTPIMPSMGSLGTCGLAPAEAGPDATTEGGSAGAAGAAGQAGAAGHGHAGMGGMAGTAGVSGTGGAGGTTGPADAGVDGQPSDPGGDVQGDDDGGCGCRAAGTSFPGRAGAALLAALGMVALAWRRRRDGSAAGR